MTAFITGGAKSGKSSCAQTLALNLAAGGPHYYIATMIPADEEDRERIRRHIAGRDGMGFETVECGRDVLSCLPDVDRQGTFLLDSATALLMNELFCPPDWKIDATAAERCARDLAEFANSVKNIVIVSDYIYSDAFRYDEATEIYRKGLAEIDRTLAEVCDLVLEISAGNRIVHKGELPL